jgi:hypothetical protein
VKKIISLLSLSLTLLLVSCGKQPITPNTDMQNEINYLLNESLKQATIATNLSGAQTINTAVVSSVTSTATCKPSTKLHFWGVALVFQESDNCLLSGSIDVSLFPLTATLNLESTKLKFVKSLKAEAKLSLAAGSLNMQFLDSRIQLRNLINLPWQELVLNGKVQTLWQNSSLSWKVRANAFESSTRMGVAILSKEPPKIGLQACFLSNGDPLNPDAGTLSACLGK